MHQDERMAATLRETVTMRRRSTLPMTMRWIVAASGPTSRVAPMQTESLIGEYYLSFFFLNFTKHFACIIAIVIIIVAQVASPKMMTGSASYRPCSLA